MGHNNGCSPAPASGLRKKLQYLMRGFRIEISGRFIRQYECRFVDKGSRYRNTLQFAA